jgi:hypothetical protein
MDSTMEDEKKTKITTGDVDAEANDNLKELDPVALNKAFRFAAWSSVVLVSTVHLRASAMG